MPRIMCRKHSCPSNLTCHRYIGTPAIRQAYFEPKLTDVDMRCRDYIEINKKEIKK